MAPISDVQEVCKVNGNVVCAFCGEPEGVHPLGCAHAIKAKTWLGSFSDTYKRCSVRNYILLCGSEGVKGSCHDCFDKDDLRLIAKGLNDDHFELLCASEDWRGPPRGRADGSTKQIVHQPKFPFKSTT
eukprot:4407660-Amphidinium_carterae.1